MPATELLYVALDDYRLALLLEASEATGRSIDALIGEAVSLFLDARHPK